MRNVFAWERWEGGDRAAQLKKPAHGTVRVLWCGMVQRNCDGGEGGGGCQCIASCAPASRACALQVEEVWEVWECVGWGGRWLGAGRGLGVASALHHAARLQEPAHCTVREWGRCGGGLKVWECVEYVRMRGKGGRGLAVHCIMRPGCESLRTAR